MTKGTITIRVNYSDWQKLKRFFPSIKGESIAAYLARYVAALHEQLVPMGVQDE